MPSSSHVVGADAIDFLTFWFSRCPEGELCEVRPLNKRRGERPRPQSWHSSTESVFAALEQSVRNGDDLYIGANPRRARGGKESDVGSLVWLYADIDFGTFGHASPAPYACEEDVRNLLFTSFHIEPSMVVNTGGGYHAWWALREPADPAQWADAINRLVYTLYADAAATDTVRILRTPGTVNFKGGETRPVTLVSFSEKVYDLADFLELDAPPVPEPVIPADRTPRVSGDTPFNRANDVPVAEVLAHLGVELHREGARTYCPCPVHGGTNASQMVVGGRRNFATCFGDCGNKPYSPVDLVAHARKIKPRDAVNYLAERFGFEGFGTNVVPGPGAEGLPAAAPATPHGSGFVWIETPDIFVDLPETKWIVDGLQLCPGRPAMCAAYGNSGKTLAAQSMLLALAAGLPIWGRFDTPQPRRVQHIDHEQGRHATLKRYQRLARGLNVTQDHLEHRLRVATFPRVYLNQPGAESEYTRACEGVDLVLLDALKGATPGEDENDSKIRECVDVLTRVSEKTGCAFWIIHHAGKPKASSNGDDAQDARAIPRGSSAIFDACGSVWAMVGKKGEPKLMSHAKAPAESEGGNAEDFHIAIRDVTVDGVERAGVEIVCVDPTAPEHQRSPVDEFCDRIVDALQATPGASEYHLRLTLRVGVRKLRDGLELLLATNRVVNVATSGTPSYRLR